MLLCYVMADDMTIVDVNKKIDKGFLVLLMTTSVEMQLRTVRSGSDIERAMVAANRNLSPNLRRELERDSNPIVKKIALETSVIFAPKAIGKFMRRDDPTVRVDIIIAQFEAERNSGENAV